MLTIDFETRSEADLQAVGAWAYSEHPSTEVICACWGVGTAPISEWRMGDEAPRDLSRDVGGGLLVEAHNVAFERAIWTNVLHRRMGWRLPTDDQWRDLMAVACYYALPAKLDKLARALGYEGKDPDGIRLISRYSKLHLKTARRDIPPEDLEKFVAYCRKDVQIEQSISDYLGDLPERELPVFLLDQRANMRGLLLDLPGIAAATAVVDQRSEELAEEFRRLTGFNPGQRDKVIAWFQTQGVFLENMQADYLGDLLEEADIPRGPARRALQIRLSINKASTKKLDAMARQVGSDGRARFQTRYHGAVTGRNTGTGFQPLNMNRGFEKMDPDQLVRDIMHRDPAWLDCVYGDAMDAVGKATRHWIRAAPGHRIMSGDFVSIEAVVNACLAGEEWKVEAFRQGAKIYEMTADKIYKLPPGTVTKETHPHERQDGKTCELAFGYQGALNAWLKFDDSGRHSDEQIIEHCRAWRLEHPAIVAAWEGYETAAIEAVEDRRRTTGYRQIGFEMVEDWLTMILPDGKRLWYFHPEIRVTMPRWHQPEVKERCAAGTCDCVPRPQLTYMAQKEGQWKRVSTYGGKLCENAVQATSRQILVPAALAAEAAGYPVILTVYDEIVCEVPDGHGSVEEFTEIMRVRPTWAADWPINVEAWEGERYRK